MSSTGRFSKSELNVPLLESKAPIQCEVLQEGLLDTITVTCVSAKVLKANQCRGERYEFRFMDSDEDYAPTGISVETDSPHDFTLGNEYVLQQSGTVYRIPEYDTICWSRWGVVR